MKNKRRYTRIVFSTPATLQINGNLFPTKLIDLSLKGALIEVPANTVLQVGRPCDLLFKLGESEFSIEMYGEIAHIERTTIGITCNKMDLESVSHLRRLVELNVGDETVLHRDLENLSHPEN